jgi:hypothetical protein
VWSNWKNFIRSHLNVLVGMDFFTTEVLMLKGLTTYDVLFFIHLETRQVKLAGFTPYPGQECRGGGSSRKADEQSDTRRPQAVRNHQAQDVAPLRANSDAYADFRSARWPTI